MRQTIDEDPKQDQAEAPELPTRRRFSAAGFAAACAAISLSVVCALGGLLFSGGLPVGAVAPALEHLIAQKTGGEAKLHGLRARVHDGELDLTASSVVLASDYRATMTDVDLGLKFENLLRRDVKIGTLTVRRIDATVPQVTPSSSEGGLAFEQVLSAISRGAGAVSLPNVNVTYVSDDDLALTGASVKAGPVDDGYSISASLPFEVSGIRTAAALDVMARPGGITDIQLTSDGAPIQPLLGLAGIDAVRLDTNFKGQVVLSVDAAGAPVGGAFDVRLRPGSGQVGEVPFEFGTNTLRASFDGIAPRFTISNLTYDIAKNRGKLVGKVAVDNILTPAELLLDFDVEGENVRVDLGAILDAPIDIATMRAQGDFDAAERRIHFDRILTSFFGSTADGSLTLTFPPGFAGNPRIESDAVLPGPLTPQQVLAGWPTVLAGEARQWVVDNMKVGVLTDLRYTSDIPMLAIQPESGLADDTMRFTFNASDATVRYVEDMPPVQDLTASALVTGNSFSVTAESGVISGVKVAGGKLSMPAFYPPGQDANFTATLVGQIPTVLAALEEAGLVEFDPAGYQPGDFSGQGRFDLSVTWPLEAEIDEDDVRVVGDGSFAYGGIDNVLPGIDAMEAEGRVQLTPTKLIVRGTGEAASAPAVFEWRQELFGDQRADLSVSAELDTVAADMAGVPLREFFKGVVSTQIYTQDLRPGAPLAITGDLTNAEVDIPALGLNKPAGLEGFFETVAAIPEPQGSGDGTDLISLSTLKLSAPTFNIEGSGVFTQDGGVVRLELPRFFIEDRADLSFRLITEERQVDFSLVGRHADAIPMLDEFFEEADPGGRLPGRAKVDIDLERVSLRNGIDLRTVKARGRHNGKDFDEFMLTSDFGADEQLSITLDRPLTEKIGYVEIEATDFGTLAAGVFGIGSVTGAAGSIKGTALAEGGFSGRFETGQLIVREAPTLARLLSIGSLDGLSDLLNGEGIRFDKLEGDVWMREGVMGFSDAKLVGSSLGISANGEVDLANGTINIRGAIAPAYAVNSVLGALPGIGRLFVSREGEGVLAFAYSLTGPIDEPTISVNTLTALTPGILRRVFEPVEDPTAGTREALDQAIAEALDPDNQPQKR
ncbi:MAG: AsmA-like C-terminal domain-containing protein [Pseudomonadota bacterium]